MGCDIHCYIEYRNRDKKSINGDVVESSWSSFGGRINPGRNYGIFTLMAGVRSWGKEDEQLLFKPKELLEGLGYSARSDNYLYITTGEECKCGECINVTAEKAKKWVESGSSKYVNNQRGEPTWVSHPDWHSHSWLSVEEFRQVLEKYKVVEQKDWELRESDRLALINQCKESLKENSWLNDPCDHYDEPRYHAMLAAMEKFEEMGYESRLVFWFDN